MTDAERIAKQTGYPVSGVERCIELAEQNGWPRPVELVSATMEWGARGVHPALILAAHLTGAKEPKP